MVEIVPINPDHIASFHRTLDVVARERRYLSFVEAPPLESTRAFVLDMIAKGYPQFVVCDASPQGVQNSVQMSVQDDVNVVGWCDVTPKSGPIEARVGVLGMGLLPQYRHQGLGTRLMARALQAARAFGFARVELSVYRSNRNAIALYEKAGFVVRAVEHARIDNRDETLLVMALPLEP